METEEDSEEDEGSGMMAWIQSHNWIHELPKMQGMSLQYMGTVSSQRWQCKCCKTILGLHLTASVVQTRRFSAARLPYTDQPDQVRSSIKPLLIYGPWCHNRTPTTHLYAFIMEAV
ncbi:hypothetical protein Droror1_Dr00014511 [Drosera rotundifolia]